MLEAISKLMYCCPTRQATTQYAKTFSVLSSGNSKQSVRELTLSSSAINPPVERPSPMVQWPTMRTPLQRLYEVGLKAADPQDAIQKTLTYRKEGIFLGNRRIAKEQVSVLSLGKAGARMAQTCEGILDTSIKQGLVVTKHDHALETVLVQVLTSCASDIRSLGLSSETFAMVTVMATVAVTVVTVVRIIARRHGVIWVRSITHSFFGRLMEQ